MCSFGGRIVPRPTDKSLSYVNGETRMVVLDRHQSLADLAAKLSRSFLHGRPFTLKYQLPNEDLDSLISVSTDEDLDNLVDEYDRLASANASGAAGKSSRIRLFLFPTKTESAPPSTIGSLLDESKSETWFVDALNNAMIGDLGIDGLPRGMSADAASVNCLLGLEDEGSVGSRGGGGDGREVLARPESAGKLGRQGEPQVFDNMSSFGSASSAPSLSNLPPILVRPDERPDHRVVEERFAQMNLGGQRVDEGFKEGGAYGTQYQGTQTIPLPMGSAGTPTVSPTENSSRVFSSDDEKLSDYGGARKTPQLPQQKNLGQSEMLSSDSESRALYINPNSDLKRESPVSSESGYRGPLPVPDTTTGGYVLPSVPPEQLQQPQPIAHLHQQPQQQFIPANAHFVHHPVTGGVVPISPYFHQIATHPIQQSQQAPLYYLPVRQPPPYNLATAVPAPTLAGPNSMQAAGNPALPVPQVPSTAASKPELQYRTPGPAPAPQNVLQPQLIRVAAPDQAHSYAGMGYHFVQQHHLSQPTATMANFGYEYTAADPANAQVYYSQTTSPPAMNAPVAQYQQVTSVAVTADAMAPGDAKGR